tara:strand:+ start:136 stop:1149 length:1014 start_codon:yes stop_codon:yes gene_type:complete
VHLGPPAATVAPPSTINNPTTFTGGVSLKNETPEDTDGGRESIVTFQGTQSGSEISTLAQIQASHDGTSDDEKGDLIFRTNDGSDGASPTTAMIIDSAQNVGINATPKETHADADVIRFGGTGYIANWEDAEVYLSENMYQDTSGAYKYLTASHASLYSQTAGKHQFRVADTGSADATITFNTALEIDNDGIVTKPLQPTFLAKKNAAQNNIAVDTLVTVNFNSEIFDQNEDYNTSTSVFTAPVTGRYLITCHILMESVDTAADYYQLRLITSNRIHYSTKDWGGYSSDPAYGVLDVIVIADMDANDTLYAAIYQSGGSAQTDLNSTTCTFSACLLA